MEKCTSKCHVLLVALPSQGHINPALQLAKRLNNMGIHVTFATTISAHRRIAKTTTTTNLAGGLTFIAFSDGYEHGYKLGRDNPDKFKTNIRSHGSKALRDTIHAAAEQGRPITCVVCTILMPWVSEVARELHIPSALLWIQSATVLSIYYHYFNGFQKKIEIESNDPSWRIEMPGTPLLSILDLPSYMDPLNSIPNPYDFGLATFKEQLDALDQETKPTILVNSFDALETDAINAIDKYYELIAVGPLVPSSEKSFGGDLYEKSQDYTEWLNSKPESSVVYISFGSLLRHQKPQMEEIAKGLLDSGRPFLWVILANEEKINRAEHELSSLNELERLGKIVPWCSQLEVLEHPSVGCFVTHCGWNSTLESLSHGVPVVAFPHWTDQGTNAKMSEDVWKTGVRVRSNEDRVVESDEVRRCVEEVMDGGERSRVLRKNAERWKMLAREAGGENGSSTKNLKAFCDQLGVGR